MRIATSLISVEQAKHNLELELAPADTVRDGQPARAAAWDGKLGVDRGRGRHRGPADDALLEPLPAEPVPELGAREHRHGRRAGLAARRAVLDRHRAEHAHADRRAGRGRQGLRQQRLLGHLPHRPGRRYSLLYPRRTPASWSTASCSSTATAAGSPRWSSPGYANLMTGTSSDVAFADAYVKGVERLRRDRTPTTRRSRTRPWRRRATRTTPTSAARACGSRRSSATRRRRVSEGVSWALEGYINDFGIANMARRWLAGDVRPGASAALPGGAPSTSAAARTDYVNMFDPAVGFFQGRDADGRWKSRPRSTTRGCGATSTTTPRPTAGTSRSTRRRTARASPTSTAAAAGWPTKLDEFFATPETAKFPGSYGGIIHEMIEARDVRMGQWGFSQPGLPPHPVHVRLRRASRRRPQEKVREALRRLYVGSEIGQGYAGDEDNGEMSAWYLFSALGFYPLQVGSAELRDRLAAVHARRPCTCERRQGPRRQRARATATENVYVQGLRLNGQQIRPAPACATPSSPAAGRSSSRWARSPSQWATGADAAPPSITQGAEVAAAAAGRDRRRGGTATAPGRRPAALFDDNSALACADARRRGCSTASTAPRGGCASTRSPRARRPEATRRSWVVEGLRRRRRAGRSLDERARRGVPLALADPAVQAGHAGPLRALPDRARPAASRRSARSSCSTRRRRRPRR